MTERYSRAVDDWRGELGSDAVSLTADERLSVYDRPLFLREDGSFTPVSVSVLRENLSTGLFWRLHRASAANDAEHGVQNFMSDIGALFEDYVDDLLKVTYVGNARALGRLFREQRPKFREAADDLLPPYQRSPGHSVDPTDGVIIEGNTVVLLEATAQHLPIRTLLGGTSGEIRAAIAVKIGRKFGQLDLSVRDLASGIFALPGLGGDPIRVIATVLLLHPFPQYYVTWDILDEILRTNGWLSGTNQRVTVVGAQIITAEELEMIAPMVGEGASLAEMLEAKIANPQYRQRSLKDFLLLERGLDLQPSARIEVLAHAFFDRVKPLVDLRMIRP
jgi:hypothetical protein